MPRSCRSTLSTTPSSRRWARGRREDVRRIMLTASGGPFRTWPLEAMRKVTLEQALKHPTLVDGAESHHRLGDADEQGPRTDRGAPPVRARPEALDVVVHPQSVVHGLVEFRDGSVVAQLGSPDMRIPIAHCLAWPVRMGTPSATARSRPDRHADVRRARTSPAFPRWRSRGGPWQPAAHSRPFSMPRTRSRYEELRRPPARFRRHPRARRGNARCSGQEMVWSTEPQSIEDALDIDHNARSDSGSPLARNCRNGIVTSEPGGDIDLGGAFSIMGSNIFSHLHTRLAVALLDTSSPSCSS